MTDAPSAPVLPGAPRGARRGARAIPRPSGAPLREVRLRGNPRALAGTRVGALAGTLGVILLALAHPPHAAAQPAHVVTARTTLRPSVPTIEQALAADSTASAAPNVPTGTAPDPRLAPDEVVGIVLDAFAQASDRMRTDSTAPATEPGDAGPFALLFAFASPGNRAALGSPDRFGAMVRDEAFRPLLRHRRAVRGALRVHGDRATQRVLVTSAWGERVAYTFVLARQDAGAQRGCWLTERVTRDAPSRLATPASA